MTTERWRRLEDLFHRAVDLQPTARAAFLAVECRGDAALRTEVEQLLRGDTTGDDAVSRIEALTRTVTPSPVPDPLLGRELGAWRLVQRLGAGGMGVVYRGCRADGLFDQEVAIKLIRAETATDWMLRRFEFERRTLAALQHPGIARLFDGGTTSDGYPWFVMELVQGEAIDRYCERHRLPLAARLRLFVQVCRAVQFAHQNLVVHCDLKPGNILIDERGQPRLLDFGIARLLEDERDRPADTASAARTVVRLLTPDYASPEQLAGAPVTTAHDVYSLGVVLHELVTARLPFARRGTSPADWERTVREQSPERPSTRVRRADDGRDAAAIARAFRSTPARLRRSLRGDLDRIVLMALRKEPARRYASVQEFADDLDRHLHGRPVRARPSSPVYVAVKFVRRNRVAVAAATAAVAALLGGLVAARRSEQKAQHEARHAATEAHSFQSIADFLMDAFLPTQPDQDPAWQQRARSRILAHAARVHRQHADADHERANLLDTLGQVCQRLDLFDDAEKLMQQALAIRAEAFGTTSLEYALSLRSLGQLQHARGDFAAAIEPLTLALALHRENADATHADVAGLANDLATCLRNVGREAEAAALHEEALARRRADGDGTLPVAESLNNRAGIYLSRGEFARATADLREAMAIRAAILGDEHPLTLQTLSNLGSSLWRLGERDEALALMRRGQQGFAALGGDGENGLAVLLTNLGAMERERGALDAATACLDQALLLQQRRLGPDHPRTIATMQQLAQLHQALHRLDRADELWREVVRARRAQSAPRDLAEALRGHAGLLLETGEARRGAALAEEALATYRQQQPPDDAAIGRAELLLGRCLLRAGDAAAGADHLRAAVVRLDATPTVSAEERARARTLLDALDARPVK